VKHRIEAKVTIRASAGRVWQIITDTSTWRQWGPSVRDVRICERFVKPGAKGHVQTAPGLWLPFEISDFISGEKWSWRIYGVEATGHRIERIADDKCLLVFDMPVFMLPYWFVCAIAIRRIRHLAEHHWLKEP